MTYATITVLGKKYIIDENWQTEASGDMGSMSRKLQIIQIASGLHEQQKEETLIHEVLHIIDMELNLNLKEADIARLAVGLYSAGMKLLPS